MIHAFTWSARGGLSLLQGKLSGKAPGHGPGSGEPEFRYNITRAEMPLEKKTPSPHHYLLIEPKSESPEACAGQFLWV